jgi:hypothetical protein
MSVQQVSQVDRYFIVDRRSGRPSVFPFSLLEWQEDRTPGLVDMYRTRSGAHHAARLLNSGAARIEPHALIGCRVVIGR